VSLQKKNTMPGSSSVRPRVPQHVLALVSLLSIFALSGFFMFAHEMSSAFGRSSSSTAGPPPVLLLEEESFAAMVSNNEYLPYADPGYKLLRQGSPPPGCDASSAELLIFMYDLPSEFHYGMITSSRPAGHANFPHNASDIPSYPGGQVYQRHSAEFWLTNDVLTSNMPDRRTPCTAFRVEDWQSADVVFVPFFASLSYNRYSSVGAKPRELQKQQNNRDLELQQKLVRYLKMQPAWQASGGSDHVIVAHHPNSMQHVIRSDVLHSAMFVVADFSRYESSANHVANVIDKDVVAPYKHVIPSYLDHDRNTSFHDRTTLLFFQGALVTKEGGIIRQKLYEILKEEPGVHFETGNTQSNGFHSATQGMRLSKFCLHLAGDMPSSNHLFDAIASHCVPVVISDKIELPFEEQLDYTEFCLFVKSTDAVQKGFVVELLRSVHRTEWTKMWNRLHQVDLHFRYQHPTQPDDAVNMVWKSISHKVPSVKFLLHKRNRYKRSKPASFSAQL
jgi:hypothetical protein